MLTYLSATMAGVEHHFTTELEEAGTKVVIAWPGTILKNRVGERGARAVELEEDDVDRVGRLRSVEDASPSVILWSQIIRAGRRTKVLPVAGATEETLRIRNFAVADGRFLTPTDVERGRRVAFLGALAARRLFGRESPLGRTIAIESIRFRVVGVSVPKGDQLVHVHGRDDLAVLVPFSAAQRHFTRTDRVREFMFSPATREGSFDAVRQVRGLLSLHHGFSPDAESAISFLNFWEALRDIFEILTALRVFVLAAGAITLLVGAIGVMNIMLVVVGERTHEIGLRKAVGARNRSIFVEFLAEATAVATLSGLLGAALGLGLTQLLASFQPPGSPASSPPVFDPSTLVVIVASLDAVGIVAGVAPALRAARIPPAEALRAP